MRASRAASAAADFGLRLRQPIGPADGRPAAAAIHLLRGIAPEVARGNLETILTTADGAGVPVLLIGMRAPGNYGPEYKAAFEANYAELAAEHGTLFLPDFFAGLGSGDPAALRGVFQADGIHPNAEGVAKIVAAIGPSVLELAQRARQ